MPHVMREGNLVLPRVAASAISGFQPVRTNPSAANEVIPLANASFRALGLAVATAATPGVGVSVQTEGVAKAYAMASLGAGALLAVGSSNGRLRLAATGEGVVAESIDTAADGDIFSVLLKPLNPVAPA